MTILCGIVFGIGTISPHFVNTTKMSIKNSLIWSSNIMAIILGALGTYCHFDGSFGLNYTKGYRQIPLILLTLYYFVFAFGTNRCTNEYAEQMIPKKCYFIVRCLLTATSWFLIYIITSMLPQLIDNIGVGWLFWFMTTMCVLMSVFVKLFVPNVNKVPEEFRLVDNSSESYSEA